MLNLKELTIEQLQQLQKEIATEIESRQGKKEYVLYTHRCKSAANYHLRKYKHWAKLVAAVDTTKTNGYAFSGDFLQVTAEHKVPEGSIIVEVCDTDITAYRLTKAGKEAIDQAKTNAMSSLIEKLASEF